MAAFAIGEEDPTGGEGVGEVEEGSKVGRGFFGGREGPDIFRITPFSFLFPNKV